MEKLPKWVDTSTSFGKGQLENVHRQMFSYADEDKDGYLNFDEFQRFKSGVIAA